MPIEVAADTLVKRPRGRPEGKLTAEVRLCLDNLLAEGEGAIVGVDINETDKGGPATREQVASKVSRLTHRDSENYSGMKVSVYDTDNGGVALEYRGNRE